MSTISPKLRNTTLLRNTTVSSMSFRHIIIDGTSHHCNRPCNGDTMSCFFTLNIERYTVLGGWISTQWISFQKYTFRQLVYNIILQVFFSICYQKQCYSTGASLNPGRASWNLIRRRPSEWISILVRRTIPKNNPQELSPRIP